eukprot:1050873_1
MSSETLQYIVFMVIPFLVKISSCAEKETSDLTPRPGYQSTTLDSSRDHPLYIYSNMEILSDTDDGNSPSSRLQFDVQDDSHSESELLLEVSDAPNADGLWGLPATATYEEVGRLGISTDNKSKDDVDISSSPFLTDHKALDYLIDGFTRENDARAFTKDRNSIIHDLMYMRLKASFTFVFCDLPYEKSNEMLIQNDFRSVQIFRYSKNSYVYCNTIDLFEQYSVEVSGWSDNATSVELNPKVTPEIMNPANSARFDIIVKDNFVNAYDGEMLLYVCNNTSMVRNDCFRMKRTELGASFEGTQRWIFHLLHD